MLEKQNRFMSKMLLSIAFLLFALPSVMALDNTTYTCMNGNLLQVNTTFVINANGAMNNYTITENYFCEKGCVQGALNCIGQASDANFGIPIFLALITACVVLFYISFAMNPEHIYMRWLFFFLGYLTLLGILFAGYTTAYDMGKDNLADQINILIFVFGIFFFILLVYILLKMTRNLFKSLKAKKEEKLIGPN